MGTAYCGFQCQKNGASIQEVLTEAAERVFGMPCSVTGCSRTDAGVHALGYVCAVSPADGTRGADWCTIPLGKIHRAFAPHLPPDISVCAAASVSDDFHPRYDASEKEYIYCIWDAPFADPFLRDRSYHSIRRISPEGLSKMQVAAAAYVDRHDFRAFMAGDPPKRIRCAPYPGPMCGGKAITCLFFRWLPMAFYIIWCVLWPVHCWKWRQGKFRRRIFRRFCPLATEAEQGLPRHHMGCTCGKYGILRKLHGNVNDIFGKEGT